MSAALIVCLKSHLSLKMKFLSNCRTVDYNNDNEFQQKILDKRKARMAKSRVNLQHSWVNAELFKEAIEANEGQFPPSVLGTRVDNFSGIFQTREFSIVLRHLDFCLKEHILNDSASSAECMY